MTPSTRTSVSAILAAAVMALVACSQGGESALNSARAYMAAKNYSGAILQLKTLLQEQPKSPEARFLLGKALFESGNIVNASVELRKALELGQAKADALPLLARCMLAMGQNQALVDEFGATTLDSPTAQADLKTTLAVAYAALTKPAEVASAIAAALKAEPGNPDTLLLQAQMATEQRRFDDAAAWVEQVIGANPANAQAWQQKGDILMLSKRDDAGAVAAYRKALGYDPQHVGALSNLMTLLILQRDLKGAREQWKALHTAAPNSLQTIAFDAHLTLLENQPKRAKELIDQVLRVAPDNIKALLLSADIEIANGAPLRAERALGRVLALVPSQRVARNQLAGILLSQGQADKVLATLQPLLAAGNGNGLTLALVGQAQLMEGRLDAAIASFSAAAKLDPQNTAAQTNLVVARLKTAGLPTTVAALQRIAAADKGQFTDLTLVSLLVRARDLDAALKALDALQAKEKDNPSTAMLRGRIQLQRKDTQAARASFERALALDPSFVQAASILAGMDLDEKKVEAAKKRFQDVLVADPRNVDAVLGLAKIMGLEGAPRNEIAERLQQAVKLDPSNPDARTALIGHYLDQRSVKAALTAAQEASAALPENMNILDLLGRAQMVSGDTNQAIGTFNRLAAQEPRSPRAYLRISGVYVAANNKQAAEQNLRRALTITPNLLEAQTALASMALADKRPQDALRVARTVQSQRPKEAVGYVMEGDIERSRKNFDGEVAVYRQALRQAPSTDLAKRLYSVLVGKQQTAEAGKFVAAWTAEQPRDAEFQAYVGDIAMAKGQFDIAERQFRIVLKLHAENALAMNNIAWILNKQGKPAAALEMAEQAVKLHPKAPGLMDTLAMVLASNNQLMRALEVQKAAVALSPDSPELRLNLAKLHIQAGDKSAARTELKLLEALGTRYHAQTEVKRLMASL